MAGDSGLFVQILMLIPFYLVGCIPSAQLIARWYGKDIATLGSGNPGAANVLRNVGVTPGVLTLLLDAGKGALAALLAFLLSRDLACAAWGGSAAVIGHCYPVVDLVRGKFTRGGKGVATSAGVLFITEPTVGILSVATFTIAVMVSRISSVGSLLAALSMPGFALLLSVESGVFRAYVVMSLLVVLRHRANISRLLLGREPKLTLKE